MKKNKITSIEYTFNEEEMETIKLMAEYCRHRLFKHDNTGIERGTNGIQKDLILDLTNIITV